jgi:CheY-like chemotaxis protein
MANVLLIDGNGVARKAMKGILARGGHRFAAVADPREAWQFLWQEIKIDLIFMDLPAKGAGGLDFLRRVRQDGFLQHLPVVVYAGEADRGVVRAALALKVQNFLVKPYHDQTIFAEVARGMQNPWRQRHFEEEKSFCALVGLKPEVLRRMLDELRSALAATPDHLRRFAETRDAEAAEAHLAELAAAAEQAGAWGASECLGRLRACAGQRNWNGMLEGLPDLDFAARLVWMQLHPGHIPDPMLTEQEREAEHEARARERWETAAARGPHPVVKPEDLLRRVETLAGCPVVDDTAATFQMLADGHPSSLVPIMEQVEMDPGLAAQVLIAANHLRLNEENDDTPVEDLRLGVDLLGELKLAALARGLVTVEERLLRAPPFTWARFWMFQIAVARLARLTCSYLEYPSLAGQAYVAGLLHDLGKLLLAHLEPFGWQAVVAYAREHGVSTAAAERVLIGCTARELADRFALTHGIPEPYRLVMRSLEEPERAGKHQELAAIVALARDLCRRNHLGHDGDQPWTNPPPLESSPAWRVLEPKIFLGFAWPKFEAQMHASCQEIKRELRGWVEAPAV